MILLKNLGYLVDILKWNLHISEIEVLCRLVECSVTLIALRREEMGFKEESTPSAFNDGPDTRQLCQWDEIPEEVSSLFTKQCESVKEFMKIKLPAIIGCNQEIPWHQELQVGSCCHETLI